LQVQPETVEAARRGDRDAFERLVRETHRSVYSLAYRIVGSHDDAADVTQETYIRVWRSLRGFRGDAAFGTWLFRIATNAALSHVRRAPRTEPLDAHAERSVADPVEERIDADAVEAALARLPDGQRAAVVLKDVYGLTCEEIGKQLGVTEGAVKVRLFRARQRLADELARAEVVVDLDRRRREAR
jgi:RNA polymerase sigma-70 factor (ECF subfamily)